jgi:hypothetical protein
MIKRMLGFDVSAASAALRGIGHDEINIARKPRRIAALLLACEAAFPS